jgi:uncharacterized protein
MTLVISAFLLGLFGSVHCVVMCGGIASTLVRIGRTARHAPSILSYNAGRIGAYVVLGALVGGVGHAVGFVPHIGGVLRLTAGLLLVGAGLYVAGAWHYFAFIERIGTPIWRRIKPLATRTDSALLMGALWGLMPCGLVYAGFGLAAAAGTAKAGALVMAAFGLGTLPAMVTVGATSARIALGSNAWLRRGAGALVLVFGLVDVATAGATLVTPSQPQCMCRAR